MIAAKYALASASDNAGLLEGDAVHPPTRRTATAVLAERTVMARPFLMAFCIAYERPCRRASYWDL